MATVRNVSRAAPAETTSDLAAYSSDIAKLNAKPLWERTTRMGPGTPAVPAIWRYRDMRPQLLRAAELISTHAATSPESSEAYLRGDLKVEQFYPMGTWAEKVRAGAMGLGGDYILD